MSQIITILGYMNLYLTVNDEGNNNNINEKFILQIKMQKHTQRRRSLHFGRMHDQNLDACCRGISSC